MQKWEALRDAEETPVKFYDVIQAGLDKLGDYQGRTDEVPAYVLAMGEYQPLYIIFFIANVSTALDPAAKLNIYRHSAHQYQQARKLLIDSVSQKEESH